MKVSNIEANTAVDIARTMILPAAARYLGELAARRLGVARDRERRDRVGGLIDSLADAIDAPGARPARGPRGGHGRGRGAGLRRHVIPAQNALREVADELETVVADGLWPLPKYRELLFQY